MNEDKDREQYARFREQQERERANEQIVAAILDRPASSWSLDERNKVRAAIAETLKTMGH
jgi:hypothetical protein